MRHRKTGVKLNRTTSHRQAMFRNMVTSLFKHDRIRTTDVKAKELRRWADHIITLAKRGDLHARRQAMAIIREKAVVHKLFEEAGNRFGAISGGYTRIVKIGRRPGDAAPISLIELIGVEDREKPGKKKTKAASKKKAKPAESKKKAEKKDKVEETKPLDTEVEAATVEPEAEDSAPEPAEPEPEQAADADEKPAETVAAEKVAKDGAESEQVEAAEQDADKSEEAAEPKDEPSESEDPEKQA
jgi:large subunit ribosomal protein L17